MGTNPWDQYAPFYDWENRRTIGKSDLAFWTKTVSGTRGPVLELGCGTGRVAVPLGRAGTHIVGVDWSPQMLKRAHARVRRARLTSRVRLVRSDMRALPFASHTFETAIAPYGAIQSMLGPRDLAAALQSVARVMKPGGAFWIDLVLDVPRWPQYQNRVRFRASVESPGDPTLIESVRQDRARRLTVFRHVFVRRRPAGTDRREFEIPFYTPSMRQFRGQLTRAGFAVERLLGDYEGGPFEQKSDALVVLARRR